MLCFSHVEVYFDELVSQMEYRVTLVSEVFSKVSYSLTAWVCFSDYNPANTASSTLIYNSPKGSREKNFLLFMYLYFYNLDFKSPIPNFMALWEIYIIHLFCYPDKQWKLFDLMIAAIYMNISLNMAALLASL